MRIAPAARIAAMLGTAACVACSGSDPGDPDVPATGGIRVTVVTEGGAPDPDGYVLTVDGGPAQRVGVNATVSLGALAAGSHRLVIDDLATNCRVSGLRERAVTVGGGQIANVEFALVCAGASGTVRVEVLTSGPDPDSDGYMVGVSGSRPARVLANAWVEIAAEEGQRSVSVTGMAPNCTASASNPSTVLVRASQVVALRLEFACTATTGSVQVVIASTGGSIDPNGYQVHADWLATPFDIGANGSVAFSQVLAGTKAVTLNGVQANCTVEGGVTRAVNVIAADTVEVRFAVRCTAFARLTITTISTGSGIPSSYGVTVAHDRAEFAISVPSNGSTTIELPFAGEYRLSLFGRFWCSSAEQSVVIDTAESAVTFAVTCQPRRTPP